MFVDADSAGTKEIAGDTEFAADRRSRSTTWNDAPSRAARTCRSSRTTVAASSRSGATRSTSSSSATRRGAGPRRDDDPARCHPESAAGITTATYVDDASSDRDGAIVDADIELNGVHFAISIDGQTLGTEPCLSELQNTLTHELGHLLGLEHTCLAPGDPPRVDDKGAAVPSCSRRRDRDAYRRDDVQLPRVRRAVKETLEPDDVAAICGIYPNRDDPGTCEHVGDRAAAACNTAGRGNGAGPCCSSLGVIFGLGRFWRRRR